MAQKCWRLVFAHLFLETSVLNSVQEQIDNNNFCYIKVSQQLGLKLDFQFKKMVDCCYFLLCFHFTMLPFYILLKNLKTQKAETCRVNSTRLVFNFSHPFRLQIYIHLATIQPHTVYNFHLYSYTYVLWFLLFIVWFR